jgi:cell division septum initiation protein DivIVA
MDEMSAITALNEAWAKVQEEAGRVEALQKKLDQMKKNEEELNQKIAALAEQSATAQKSVSDAQKQATKIIADAQREAAHIRGNAVNDKIKTLESAKVEAAGLVSKARSAADKLTKDAQEKFDSLNASAIAAADKYMDATSKFEQLRQAAKTFVE